MASADGSEAAYVAVNISDVRLANITAHNSCLVEEICLILFKELLFKNITVHNN